MTVKFSGSVFGNRYGIDNDYLLFSVGIRLNLLTMKWMIFKRTLFDKLKVQASSKYFYLLKTFNCLLDYTNILYCNILTSKITYITINHTPSMLNIDM